MHDGVGGLAGGAGGALAGSGGADRARSRSPAGQLETHGADDPAWDGLVREAASFDFYHCASYHALAEARGEGRAVLFAYREGVTAVALPLLLRRVAEVPGLESSRWLDATSVYGYSGPVSVGPPPSDETLARFQEALRQRLREMSVVAVFSRLHPLLPQPRLLRDLGRIERLGPTASIDLSLPLEEQRRAMAPAHRNQVNKLRRSGAACFLDVDGRFLTDFVAIYLETMSRVAAGAYYQFDAGYFNALRTAMPDQFRLFVVRLEDRTICAGVFMLTGDIVQYHLSGTLDAYIRMAPMKLLLDEVRLWAIEAGARRFHLGGGLGARADSLFDFKRRFATDVHDFHVWKWVVDDGRYEQLCSLRAGGRPPGEPPSFFPTYRA